MASANPEASSFQFTQKGVIPMSRVCDMDSRVYKPEPMNIGRSRHGRGGG